MQSSPAHDQLLNAAATPGTPQFSKWFHVGGRTVAGLQFSWAAGVTGIFSCQGSNVPAPTDADAFDLTLDDAIAQPAGTVGCSGIDLSPYAYEWLRVKYVGSVGTGVVTVWGNAKGE